MQYCSWPVLWPAAQVIHGSREAVKYHGETVHPVEPILSFALPPPLSFYYCSIIYPVFPLINSLYFSAFNVGVVTLRSGKSC